MLVVGSLALRDVVERRRDARTAGVPGEVAAVERVVAVVVEVLDVEVRDAVGAAAVEGSRRRVEGRVDPRREHRLLRGVDPVLVEREVDAADDRRAERVEDPGGRQQGEVVPRGRLDAERPEQDAIAVAVVDEPRLVVERVRVAEGAAGVGIAALCDGRVAADEPDLAVRGRGEDVPAARHERAGGDTPAHTLAALPVPARSLEVVGRARVERRRDNVDVEHGVDELLERGAGQLGHVEELRDPCLDDHLVPDPRHVAADQRREAAHEDEDPVGGVRVVVGARERVLEEEAVLRRAGRRARERLLRDHAAHEVRLPLDVPLPLGGASGERNVGPSTRSVTGALHVRDAEHLLDVDGRRAAAGLRRRVVVRRVDLDRVRAGRDVRR